MGSMMVTRRTAARTIRTAVRSAVPAGLEPRGETSSAPLPLSRSLGAIDQLKCAPCCNRPVGHDLGPRAMTLAATFCASSPFYGDAQEMHRVRQRGKKQFRCSCEAQIGWRASTLGQAAAVKQLHGHRDGIRASLVPHGEGELEAQVLASAFSDSLSESTGTRHELSTRVEIVVRQGLERGSVL